MTNDFISTIAAGLLAALVVFLLSHLSKRIRGEKLPKWVMPAAIGAALIGYTIWSEYSWFPEMRSEMPDTVVVLQKIDESVPWRPWTYLVPMVTRFMAVDGGKVEHPVAGKPELVETDLLLIGRWQNLQTVPTVYDCKTDSRADLVNGATLSKDGELSGGGWLKLTPDDPGLKAVCAGG
ncbi:MULTISPECIES: hypothetical protein [Thioclava]|uniref:hypothetical protein n=1 Tax=Thioclava TaxID=285107 RepID=UPI000B53B88A|nr:MULTISPECIES: hypothetical protein [Thioclava]OWY03165.1 hypothetical protein B6V76_09925 [Thioclava sp. IC9]OWY16201.1 hypothetical protein B6V73_13545 [Thioclava sp. JM3]PWE51666.1 hypothetical protein DEM26_01515 [Thioclava sp. NG1]WGT49119.1 hypothetical protein P0N61_12375 [Thioclava nitratireducens]